MVSPKKARKFVPKVYYEVTRLDLSLILLMLVMNTMLFVPIIGIVGGNEACQITPVEDSIHSLLYSCIHRLQLLVLI